MPDYLDEIASEMIHSDETRASEIVMRNDVNLDIIFDDVRYYIEDRLTTASHIMFIDSYLSVRDKKSLYDTISKFAYVSEYLIDDDIFCDIEYREHSYKIVKLRNRSEATNVVPREFGIYHVRMAFDTDCGVNPKRIFRFLNFMSSMENMRVNMIEPGTKNCETIHSGHIYLVEPGTKINELDEDSKMRFRMFDIPYRYKLNKEANLNCNSIKLRFSDNLYKFGTYSDKDAVFERVEKWFELTSNIVKKEEKSVDISKI